MPLFTDTTSDVIARSNGFNRQNGLRPCKSVERKWSQWPGLKPPRPSGGRSTLEFALYYLSENLSRCSVIAESRSFNAHLLKVSLKPVRRYSLSKDSCLDLKKIVIDRFEKSFARDNGLCLRNASKSWRHQSEKSVNVGIDWEEHLVCARGASNVGPVGQGQVIGLHLQSPTYMFHRPGKRQQVLGADGDIEIRRQS